MNKRLITICQNLNQVLTSLELPLLELQQQGEDCLLLNRDMRLRVLWKPMFNTAVRQQFPLWKDQTDLLLMTTFITPADSELLRKYHIQYADTAGNCYLHTDKMVIDLANATKPPQIEEQKIPGRAWTVAGLKLLFLLLTKKDALNWPYRKMNQFSGVSLGSIRYIMEDLQHSGILLKIKGQFVWQNFNEVMNKWCDYYIDKIVPRLERRYYTGNLPGNLSDTSLLLSGESANICRQLLKMEHLLAYKTGNINPCILQNHWQEAPTGSIEIRLPFWPVERQFDGNVPALLVYADLMAEQDSRCREAAEQIYQRYLKDATKVS